MEKSIAGGKGTNTPEWMGCLWCTMNSAEVQVTFSFFLPLIEGCHGRGVAPLCDTTWWNPIECSAINYLSSAPVIQSIYRPIRHQLQHLPSNPCRVHHHRRHSPHMWKRRYLSWPSWLDWHIAWSWIPLVMDDRGPGTDGSLWWRAKKPRELSRSVHLMLPSDHFFVYIVYTFNFFFFNCLLFFFK